MSQTVERLIAILPNKNRRLHAGYSLILVIGVIAAFILLGDRTNIYSVKGTTQALTIVTTSSDINEWEIQGGILVAEDLFMEPVLLSAEKAFRFSAGSKIRFTAVNEPDQNHVLITTRDSKLSGALIDNSSETALAGYVEVLIPVAQNLVLPFEGKAFMGEDVGEGVESLLLNGEVSILESRFLSSGRYQGETFTLDTGDRATIIDLKGEHVSKGFVRITDSDAFYFSVVSEGDGVQVTRFGNEDLTLTPSIWTRVTKDPIVAAITSLFALMFLLLEFSLLVKQTIKNKES